MAIQSSVQPSIQTITKEKLTVGDIGVHILLIGIGLLVSMPILIAFFTSFKPPTRIITFPPTLIPSIWTFENYILAWESTPFGRFLLNSIVQSSLITIGQVLFSLLAAYAFAILVFPGRNLIFYVVLGSLMVPFELTFIPNFVFVSEYGGANTYWGLTIPFLANAFGVFMLRQFFLTLPKELHDAAQIDGAGNWRYLWQIVVPLSKGSIGAFAIFAFLSAWNQYLWPLIMTSMEEMRTLQIGIRFFMSNLERGADWGPVMAGSMIALGPALLAFLVAQKQLVQGIAMTGLKG
ncbi:carbohydrate ABC transporter permease [Chloroflexi bacterium TSY]|nr:carbohydrate ABC transporter permease [Chloroflexi bacterium TSY]